MRAYQSLGDGGGRGWPEKPVVAGDEREKKKKKKKRGEQRWREEEEEEGVKRVSRERENGRRE